MNDPLVTAAEEAGVKEPVQVLANVRSPLEPWVVYGPGAIIDSTTIDAAVLADWRAEGKVTAVLASIDTTPPPPVITNVVATPDAADGTLCTVTWTTDVAADSQVHYGADASYGSSSVLEPGMVTEHTVALSGLTVATEYHYAAASSGATSADDIFTTAA